MRTLVFSDVHGEPAIITTVVEHSGYDPRTDRLIFAGDAIEVGRDSPGCLELLDELGAECLVGNHEFGVFTGWPIESEPVEPGVLRRVCVFQLKSHTIPVEIAQRSARSRTAFRRKSHAVPL
jgi:hypothetical protein